jgi:hypothetical protein
MSRVFCGWMIAGALLLMFGTARHAYGDTFDLTWTGAYGPGSATLTATFVSGDEYLVTAMTGAQNGSAVSLLDQGVYGFNDNAIFPFLAIQLDIDGLGFSAGGVNFNLFAFTLLGNTNTYTECSSAVTICIGDDEINKNALAVTTLAITPVPEPTSVALLGAMALGVVHLLRRRFSRACVGQAPPQSGWLSELGASEAAGPSV